MQIPLEISYRNVHKSETLEEIIQHKIDKLEKICDYITSCRVAIEKPQLHQKTGNPFRVRISLKMPPGHELVVRKESGKGDMHEGLTKVVRDAFDAVFRQVQELVEKQRADVKVHPEQMTNAVVDRIYSDEGYGFLRSTDGREIYFHKNSVLNNHFSRLSKGDGVRYVEEIGDDGAQASTVQLVEKPVKG